MKQKLPIILLASFLIGIFAGLIFVIIVMRFKTNPDSENNNSTSLINVTPAPTIAIPVIEQVVLDNYGCQPSNPLSDQCTNLYLDKSQIDKTQFDKCLQTQDFTSQIAAAEKSYQDNKVGFSPSVFIAKKNGDKLEGFEVPESTQAKELKTILNYLTQNNITKTHDLWIASQLKGIENEINKDIISRQSEFSNEATQQQQLTTQMAEIEAKFQQGYPIKPITITGGITQGNSNTNYIIVFIDFSCSYCKLLFQNIVAMLQTTYLDNNQVTLVTFSIFNEYNKTEMVQLDKKLRCADEQNQLFNFQNYYFSILE
ncbi:MAG: DsbA family protein [bacterium]